LWYKSFGKPILITEFALQNFNGGDQPTSEEIFSFMDQAITWMNSQDYILGYYPFGKHSRTFGFQKYSSFCIGFMEPPTGINANMNLLNGDGSLTSLGSFILDKSGAK
jgi:Glycosyl hydrolase catalytic core